MRTFSGPSSDPESDTSAADAKRLRQVNAVVQELVDRRVQAS